VFVKQPPSFENHKYPNRVYKLSNVLYEKQAPRAWYDRLNTFFLEHGCVMESVDKTLYFETWQYLFTCSDLHE
jgi:hypothetical protein